MVSLRCSAVFGLFASVVGGQCPSPNFLQASEVNLVNTGVSIAGLQRQADGSYTRQRFQYKSPFTKIDATANFQTAMVNCTGAAPRTFRPPSNWHPLADLPGVTSQSNIMSDLLGTGIPAGLGAIAGGHVSAGGPANASFAVILGNPDISVRSAGSQYYPSPDGPNSVLAADLNGDGKKDVVVTTTLFVSVYIGNGDGTLKPAVNYMAGQSPVTVAAWDFNNDGFLDLAVVNRDSSNVSILMNKGDGTFKAAVNYPAGSSPYPVVVGDFNNDGKADLVVGSFQKLSILLGNGDGTFKAATDLSEHFFAGSMATGDLNKDGKLDLVVLGNGTLIVLLGNGAGGFSSESDYAVDSNAGGVFVTDLDGDGNLDVVLGAGHPDALMPYEESTSVSVLFGRGDGTLIAPLSYTGGLVTGVVNIISGSNSIAAADFNGDSKVDLALVSRGGSDVWIFLNQGGTTFLPTHFTVQASGFTVAAGTIVARDFNGDGKQDLVIADSAAGSAYVLLGKGDGTFQPAVRYGTGGAATAAAVGDFNGDGKLDLAIIGPSASGTNGSLAILLGNGDGTFQAVKTYAGTGSNPAALALGDFNKDGKLDVVVANQGTNTTTDKGGLLLFTGQGNGIFPAPVSVPGLINPSAVAAGDVNGDGFTDLVAIASNFFGAVLINSSGVGFQAPTLFPIPVNPASIVLADLNLDGKLDLIVGHCCDQTDVTTLLGNGDGTFQPQVEFTPAVSPTAILAADINGDGKPDLITGYASIATVAATNGSSLATLSSIRIFPNITVTTVTPPAPVSVSPASGTGSTTQSTLYTFTYTDPRGFQDMGVLNILINNFLDGRFGCYLAYSQPFNVLYLVNDPGTGLLNGPTPGGVGTVGNSQCTIDGPGSSVTTNGNTLKLMLSIKWGASFAGNKVIYMAARDVVDNNSGWLPLGVVQVPGGTSNITTAVTGMGPSDGSGHSKAYIFHFTNSKGFADIGVMNVLVNDYINGNQACYIAYSRPANLLFVVNDAGTALSAGLPLGGTTGSVGNSQCTITVSGSSVSTGGNNLDLTLNITWGSSFAGSRIFYLAVRDVNEANNTGWQSMGAWLVQ